MTGKGVWGWKTPYEKEVLKEADQGEAEGHEQGTGRVAGQEGDWGEVGAGVRVLGKSKGGGRNGREARGTWP